MAGANKGNTVKVMYTGRHKDSGEIFDSNEGREPLEFVMGEGMVIAGFEKAVLGLSAGESASIEIPPADAYGDYMDNMVIEVRREQLPPEITPEIGAMLQIATEDGGAAYVHIKEFDDETIKLDANHPLAGQTLLFDIEVVEVK